METTEIFENEAIDTNYRVDENRHETRWIVFCGDRTPPEFKRRFNGMGLGGENLGSEYKTLFHTKGLLRRCQLTPMAETLALVNPYEVGIGQGEGAVIAPGVKTIQRMQQHSNPKRPDEREMVTLYGFPTLPADELEGLLQVCQGNNDYGIREVESLRGDDPPKQLADGSLSHSKATAFQTEIFPDWKDYQRTAGDPRRVAFFKTTRVLDTYLRERKLFVSDECAEVIDILLDSNSQFERWAAAELAKMSVFVKAPPTAGGKVYTWEKQHVQWFDDLDLNREEFLQRRVDTPSGESNAPSLAEFNELKSMLKELTAATLGMARNAAPVQGRETADDPNKEPLAVREYANAETETKTICTATTKQGEPCSNYIKGDSEYCRSHQPGEV